MKTAIDRCEEILRPYLKQPLLSVLYPEPGASSPLDETAYTQPALFALEYALAQLWQSWGIEPAFVCGTNVGEYVAACVAGVFSLEDGLKLIAQQGREAFSRQAYEIAYSSPKVGLISNVTGQLAGEAIAKAEYWVRHVSSPVKFSASIQKLHELGCELFLEIGPNYTLTEGVGTWLLSLKEGREDWEVLLQSLGTLYVKGVEVNWAGFDRDYQRQKIALPTYPFERQRYWIKAGYRRDRGARAGREIAHPLLGQRLHSPLIQFESQFSLDSLPLVKDHQLYGMPLVNLVVYLEMALAGAAEAFGTRACGFEDVSVPQALILSEEEIRTVQLIINSEESGKAAFKIFSLKEGELDEKTAWTLHAAGKIC